MNGLLIGELAQRTGIKAQTIRYYERLGVLTAARRTAAGYRRYGPDAAAELAFIKNAQALGFSLDDIKRVLDLSRSGRAPCSTVLALAKEHLSELDRRIEQLQSLRQHLTTALRRWESGGAPPDCASTLCGLISDAADVTHATPVNHLSDQHSGRPPVSYDVRRR
jgi:DNA-binding transcriptional MerR regulator